MSNMKVIGGVTIFPKYPRTHWDHTWAKRIKAKKLGFHSWIIRQILWWTRTKSIAMLHNIHFADLKLIYHSLIKFLYNLLNYDPSVWVFVQLIIPFLEESNISILEKFTLITKSTLLELCTCSFYTHFIYKP